MSREYFKEKNRKLQSLSRRKADMQVRAKINKIENKHIRKRISKPELNSMKNS